MRKTRRRSGQSLVELLVAIGIGVLVLPAMLTGIVASREGRVQQRERLSATALVTEATEAVRSVRARSWTNVATNGTYHPAASLGSWTLAAGEEQTSGFTRSVVISDALRNGNGALVETGGTPDPSTKRIDITVLWQALATSTVGTTLYLSRFTNETYTETSQADFEAGTPTDVVITNTAGGEVTLAAGGNADWCEPELTINPVNLPKQGVANGVTAIEGLVFAGTGDNASGESWARVTISNTDPPVGALNGTFSNYKTNGVFGEESYGYIATDTNAKEIIILDITANPFVEIGSFDSPGPTDANSIFVLGNVGYMIAGTSLYTFDLTSKADERPQLGSVALAGVGNRVYVAGDFAYVAVESSTTQLQIVDVANPASPQVVSFASLPALAGRDVVVNQSQTRAYVAAAGSSTLREMFIVDITTKTGSQPIVGSYDTQGMSPKGVRVVTNNKAIIVGTSGLEYQVVDIATETAPQSCGGLQVDTGVNGVSSVVEADGDVYSYIITGDDNAELKIIEGGPGGQFATSGTFESATFDAGSVAMFNRFAATTIIPPQTTITFQFAGADPIAGSCDGVTFAFVGPDGTPATQYMTTSSALAWSDDDTGYENPVQCFRYRAYLSATDLSQSPILMDMSVNYSP